jgi:trans-aconitate 2-methyltransferase
VTTSSAWDPAQYDRFAAERSQPFHDLVALVARVPIARAVDLGCGTGALTAELVRERDIHDCVGVDNSSSMLAEAALHVIDGRLRFEAGDVATWTSAADHDLVLANASLQWVPDHAGVLARWTAALAPGGQLAVQVPSNSHHSAHTVAAEIAGTEPFLSALRGEPPVDPVAVNVLRPEAYASLLHDLGFVEQSVRLQVYPHLLGQTSDVVEWVKGTTLTRFKQRLEPARYEEFLAAYRARLLQVLGDTSPFFYPFNRVLLWGRRPS